jgi:hypothetical protein
MSGHSLWARKFGHPIFTPDPPQFLQARFPDLPVP